jgi:hypothetical protein
MLAKITLCKITFAVTASIALLAAPTARAAEDQDRVAIESFRGPHAQRLQGAVESGLMGRYYLVPDFSVEQMARRRGVAMNDPDGMAQVGRALQVRAFLSAEVQKKHNWHVQVVVRSGDTGAALGRFVVADRSLDHLESTLATRTSHRVGMMLAREVAQNDLGASASPRAARGSVTPPELSAAAEPASNDERPGEIIEVEVETRVFNRSFSYNQNLSGLSDYHLTGALAGTLAARFHPLAAVSPDLAPLGISAALEYGLGVGSRVAGSEERISTDVHGYSVGLGYRLRLGRGASTLTPSVGYALSIFNAGQGAGAPNVDYRVVKPGLDGRWAATERLSVRAHGEYLYVLSTGALSGADRFPRATATGVEAGLGLGFALTKELDLEVDAGLRRYGITTNVVPGDRSIAGGAVDQTTWLGLGLAYRPSYRRGL